MSHLETLVKLQQTLRELEATHRRLDTVPDWMTELHEEHSTRKAEIEAEEAKAEASLRERRAAEVELEDAQEKLKRYQGQVSQVTTQREYGALLKEIDTVKQQIQELETQAMTGIEENEAATEKAATLRDDFAELDQRYQAELAKWDDEKPGFEAKARELETLATELRGEMPPGTLSLFERLFERTSGDATAAVMAMSVRGSTIWHCGGCSFNVRPQVVVEVRDGTIRHCDSCKRILFLPPEAETES